MKSKTATVKKKESKALKEFEREDRKQDKKIMKKAMKKGC